jgi:hypothetical protein
VYYDLLYDFKFVCFTPAFTEVYAWDGSQGALGVEWFLASEMSNQGRATATLFAPDLHGARLSLSHTILTPDSRTIIVCPWIREPRLLLYDDISQCPSI